MNTFVSILNAMTDQSNTTDCSVFHCLYIFSFIRGNRIYGTSPVSALNFHSSISQAQDKRFQAVQSWID